MTLTRIYQNKRIKEQRKADGFCVICRKIKVRTILTCYKCRRRRRKAKRKFERKFKLRNGKVVKRILPESVGISEYD